MEALKNERKKYTVKQVEKRMSELEDDYYKNMTQMDNHINTISARFDELQKAAMAMSMLVYERNEMKMRLMQLDATLAKVEEYIGEKGLLDEYKAWFDTELAKDKAEYERKQAEKLAEKTKPAIILDGTGTTNANPQ